jgi:hypothetical protein
VSSMRPAVSEIQLFKKKVFLPKSEKVLLTSFILLNIVKNIMAYNREYNSRVTSNVRV